MAEIPKNRLDTLANFGPRLQYNQGATIKPGMKIDKLVDIWNAGPKDLKSVARNRYKG